MGRVIGIFLDGYDVGLEREMRAAGELPALTALAARSARFSLDHGLARNTGLAGEHVASGLSPEDCERYAAVHFDPARYTVCQVGATTRPFLSDLQARTVVFDMPYLDLAAAPDVRGIASWGAHDPGVPPTFRPAGLARDFDTAIGPYPASDWIYGYAWPSLQSTEAMGSSLAAATDLRTVAIRWLLDRLPDWELALVGVSEPHSAIEGLWHGIDPDHPLRSVPSARAAGEGLREVYRAVDRLIGALVADHPDSSFIVFSIHGMGSNRSDVASMLLLPELMYRQAFGRSLFRQPPQWQLANGRPCMPITTKGWNTDVSLRFPWWRPALWRTTLSARAPWRARGLVERLVSQDVDAPPSASRGNIDWMPATAYRPYWHRMPMFALPSFYDGRIRVNLVGREGHGMVQPAEYDRTLDETERLVRECVDRESGEPIVETVIRTASKDSMRLAPTAADLTVIWRRATQAIRHPRLGDIGPVPYRRSGGHSGPEGMAYVCGAGVAPGDFGLRSSFDVVPTLIQLLGASFEGRVSGGSLLGPVLDRAA